ncbi:Hpt domain-containing protein [Lysobacter sp. cf310]|uniref:Hpt domain-containing protein n=1 Tax=Lysobacter sp. cf310 TaxID=1761790 RepID=UPI0008EC706F|nr:Hpt domain-containing protein [Lysobacter sp. cf310]SFL26675.1 chemosensory pili system protein ChpA (sensor histidine kinase/response regulator) [Lysobacter sp. cf310]
MTALREAIDTTTLGWIKPELDETLRQARQEIEAYAEDPTDTSRMRFCASHLHQVHGTLRMVELYAPAMVAEEMERLALALQQGQVGDRDEACAALMRGVVLLPDYLERLQGGHRDIPIVLLPLLNELRASRGEAGLNESVLFAPDLDRPLPAHLAPPPPSSAARGSTNMHLSALRDALAAWPEDGAPADPSKLAQAVDGLLADVVLEPVRRMLWVASSVAGALRDGALPPTRALRQAFGGVEREARQMLADDGFSSPRGEPAAEPTRQLLYHVAHSDGRHPALDDLRQTFELASHLPSESELEHARGSLSGRNRALLDTVSAAIKEDLLRVKDALDLHLRTNQTEAGELRPQIEALARVSDTLGMMGLGVARTVVLQQRDAMIEIVEGKRPADEGALLDVAGALLYVDASLDDQVSRLGLPEEKADEDLLAGESRKVLDVVVREAIANFGDARQSFVAFVETNWDHAELVEVPRVLDEVAGALRMLELPLPADYLTGVKRYTEVELIGRHRVPNGQQLDTLADALASLEYYLEALREQRPNRDDILDIARQSLEALRYWPLPEVVRAPDPAAVSAATPSAGRIELPEAAEIDAMVAGRAHLDYVAPEALAPVPAAAPVEPAPAPAVAEAPRQSAATGGFAHSDDIDDEIRDIFLEEFKEEIGNLDDLLPAWRESPDDLERLYPIRRVFHTLKGSGRLVGAKTLGEFSWKIESLLNRVRDHGRAVSPELIDLVGHAHRALPQLYSALRNEGPITADLAGIEAHADLLATGEEAFYRPMHLVAPAAPAVEAPVEPVLETVVEDAPAPVEVESESFVLDVEPEALELEAEPEAPAAIESVGADSVPASVDAVLLEILDTEVTGHLVTIQRWLAAAQAAPSPADDGLQRAIHTLNGAFAMTEVPVITDVIAPTEVYVKRLLAAGGPASDEGVAAIGAVAVAIERTLASLKSEPQSVPVFPGLAERMIALRDSLPDARSSLQVEEPHLETVESAESPFADTSLDSELTALDLSEFGQLDDEAVPAGLVRGHSAADLDAPESETSAAGEFVGVIAGAIAAAIPSDDALSSAADAERAAAEAERLAAERAEAERLEAERVAAEQADAERLAAERAEAERLEAERVAAEQAEAERIAAEQTQAERVEAERLAAEQAEAERLEAERLAAEQAEAERAEAERLAAEQAEAERLEAERLAAEQAEAERLEAERLAAEQAEAERLEAERLAAEQAEAERLEAERVAAEQAEAERLEAERLAAEQAEAERLAAERLAAEQAEAERLAEDEREYARLEAEYAEAERVAREQQAAAEAAIAAALAPPADALAPLPAANDETESVETESLEAQPLDAQRDDELEEIEYFNDDPVEDGHVVAEPVAVETVEVAEPAPLPETLKRIVEANPDPDEALDLAELDPELVDIFVEEGGDLLDHSDGLLAQLREAPNEREPLVGLQRDLHTLKGGARMAGIMAVGELGHAMESLLEAVVDQRSELGRDGVPLLERGFDRLHAMVTRVGTRRAIAMPEALIAEFDARARGEIYTAPTVTDDGTIIPASAPKVELKPLSAPMVEVAVGDDDDIGVRAPQEQVRIRADLLDRLVNYAGEVAIYRARLEQQLGAFRGAIAEMAQTNTRMRDQLRRLEIETEAQIIARYQREGDASDQSFDPLELDRFSNLQQLSRALSESAADQGSLQTTLDDLTRQYETLLLQQSRVSSDLQEGLMRTRMVPFDALLPRLRRVVRQASGELGKQVQLKLEGTQGELDRNVLERMTAPLEHMLRNAVAHGLEAPAQRKKAGKPEEGTVRIAVRREGSEVVLEVADDGAGLDRAAIRRRGEERGLVRSEAVLADSDLDALILEPGFSTADEVSRLAGRGVGMDVVASEVRQLGGTLDIQSRPGKGVTFLLRLPQTLAVTQAVFVRIGDTTFAVPIASVRGVGRIAREGLEAEGANYRYGGEDYAVHDLGLLLGHAPAKAEGQLQMPLLLIRSGDLRAAVTVDQVVGNREIVVKPVGPQVASVPGIFGGTIMGDGRVVVILDVAPLVRRHALLPRDYVPAPVVPVETRRVPLVMVVDDSVTMRKVTGRVLERHNFEVLTAKDGLDALERMTDVVPDLMLLDIEMPRMDGYELATQMKSDARLRDVPIVMITSRTGDKHRQRAFEIGVERYLGKPYQEPELMRNVFELLGIARHHE